LTPSDEGSVPIAELDVADSVIARNPDTGRVGNHTVAAVTVHAEADVHESSSN
jgi:hypothetical protein